MAKEQKGFIVYGDIEPVVDRLSDEEAGQLLKGMVKYFNSGEEPNFTGALEFVFIPIQQQMDRDAKKYVEKCEKNRQKIQSYWDRVKADTNEYNGIPMYSDATNTNTNTDTNTDTNTKTDKDTNTEFADANESAPSLSEKIISYLNEKTGARYATDSKTSVSKINALVSKGYTENDIRTVIDKKCADWLNDEKMREHLRPSVLFGSKFEEYLSAPISLKLEKERKKSESNSNLEKMLKEKQTALEAISGSIEDLRGEDGRFGENVDEYRILNEQKAILEDSINRLQEQLKA